MLLTQGHDFSVSLTIALKVVLLNIFIFIINCVYVNMIMT